jgi:hypothetical protein
MEWPFSEHSAGLSESVLHPALMQKSNHCFRHINTYSPPRALSTENPKLLVPEMRASMG